MDDERITILRDNRRFLEKKITNIDAICSSLFAQHVTTDEEKEDIEIIQNPTQKIRKILDLLPKKENKAFDIFHTILMQTENVLAAGCLKPNPKTETMCDAKRGFVLHRKLGDGSNPGKHTSINDDDILTQEKELMHCDRSSYAYTEYWNNDKAYSMKKQKRGRAIIISNWHFDQARRENVQLEDREGAEVDRDRLKLLFEQLFFEVIVFNDATGQNIKDMLEEEQTNPYHKSADCFILIILSHGSNTGIYGVDGTVVSADSITGYFTARSCPSLAEKPKLFFIQACKGVKSDVKDSASTIADNVDDQNMFLNRFDAIKRSSTEHSDIFIAYSTYQGFTSIRNALKGACFIQAMISQFRKHSHTEDLLSLMIMVQRKVSNCRTNVPGTKIYIRETANHSSSLVKKLYFFPGCHE